MKLYLLTYDVSTQDKAGQARLRRVAKACEGRGCRVQKSVFECRLTQAQLEELRDKIKRIIDLEQDSLRIYKIVEPLERNVQVLGVDNAIDFTEPLIF